MNNWFSLRMGLVLWAGLVWPLAAAITGFSPVRGEPGTTVTITGSGFTGLSQVRFDQILADFDVLSSTQIQAIVPPDALTGPLRVDASATSSNFVVAPRIASFEPARGLAGTPVVIRGANFISGGTTVTFHGSNAASVTNVSETQLVATAPTGVTTGPLRVTTVAGGLPSTNNFEASGSPLIASFDPQVGTNGATVLVKGANFVSGTAVFFNGVKSQNVTLTAVSQLYAVVPPGANTGLIAITNTSGTATSSIPFTTGLKPIFTNISPTLGPIGAAITLKGYNFLSVTSIWFNGRPAGASAQTPNLLQTFVPSGASSGPIVLGSPAGFATSSIVFVTGTQPVITNISPALEAVGAPITLSGFNLTGVTNVKFNTRNIAVTPTADTQIPVTVPSGATSGPLSVSGWNGTNATSLSFQVIGAGPYISSITPDHGPRGTSVILGGAHFTGATNARFNGVSGLNGFVTSDTQLQIDAPTNVTTGPLSVSTLNGTTNSALLFYAPPRLSSVSPSNAIVGTPITVTGRNFTGATALELNNAPIAFSVNTASNLAFTVPTNAATGLLRLTAPGGLILSLKTFAVLPKIYSFSPLLGPVGTTVTVQGTTFGPVTNVQFNGVNASFTLVSPQEIRATVPPGASTGPIRVQSADGADTNALAFIVTVASDLALAKRGAPDWVMTNEIVTYTLEVTNKGPSIVTGVLVKDILPFGLQVIQASSTLGACAVTNINGTNIVSCAVPAFTNLTAFTVTITVRTDRPGGYVNAADVTAVEGDTLPGSNHDETLNKILSAAQRTLQIQRADSLTNVVLFWPVSAMDFRLEQSEALAPTNWQTNLLPRHALSNYYWVTSPILNPTEFFRLHAP